VDWNLLLGLASLVLGFVGSWDRIVSWYTSIRAHVSARGEAAAEELKKHNVRSVRDPGYLLAAVVRDIAAALLMIWVTIMFNGLIVLPLPIGTRLLLMAITAVCSGIGGFRLGRAFRLCNLVIAVKRVSENV